MALHHYATTVNLTSLREIPTVLGAYNNVIQLQKIPVIPRKISSIGTNSMSTVPSHGILSLRTSFAFYALRPYVRFAVGNARQRSSHPWLRATGRKRSRKSAFSFLALPRPAQRSDSRHHRPWQGPATSRFRDRGFGSRGRALLCARVYRWVKRINLRYMPLNVFSVNK